MTWWLLACAPSLGPDLAVGGDAMLAALPADVTVVGGLAPGVLADADTRAVAARFGLDPAAIDRRLADAGLDGAGAIDRAVFGCGDAGCAALLEGRFAALDVGAVADGTPARALASGTDAVELVDRRGQRFVFGRLAPDRAVAGDRAALRAIDDAARDGASLDPAVFAGVVPAGDVWVAARDPRRFVAQARVRGERAGAASLVAGLDALAAAPLDHVEAVAAALSVGPVAELRVRAVLTDTATAVAAARAAADRVDRHRDRLGALRVDVVRDGRRVELSAVGPADAFLAAAEAP